MTETEVPLPALRPPGLPAAWPNAGSNADEDADADADADADTDTGKGWGEATGAPCNLARITAEAFSASSASATAARDMIDGDTVRPARARPPPTPTASAAARFELDLSAARDAEGAALQMRRVVERMRDRVEELASDLMEVEANLAEARRDIDAAVAAEVAADGANLGQQCEGAAGSGEEKNIPATPTPDEGERKEEKKKKVGRGNRKEPSSVTPQMVEEMLDKPWKLGDKSGNDRRGHSLRYKDGGVYCAACESAVSYYLIAQHICRPRHAKLLEEYKIRKVVRSDEGSSVQDVQAEASRAMIDRREVEARASDLDRRLRIARAALADAEWTLGGNERVAEMFRHSAEAAREDMGAEAREMELAALVAKAEADVLKASLAKREEEAKEEEEMRAATAAEANKKRARDFGRRGGRRVDADSGDEGDEEKYEYSSEEDHRGGESSSPPKKRRGKKCEPGVITRRMVEKIISKPWKKGTLSGPSKRGHSLRYYNGGLFCKACRKSVSLYLATQHIVGETHEKLLEEYRQGGGTV